MKALAAALAAAQGEMPAVKPNATNPHFKSKFVTLDHLLAAIRPVLRKHGLAVAQFPSIGPAGEPALTTTLLHTSGEHLTHQMLLLPAKPDPQGQGSALTYARRYALSAVLGISSEEDDDGNAASEPVKASKSPAKPAPAKAAPPSASGAGAPQPQTASLADMLPAGVKTGTAALKAQKKQVDRLDALVFQLKQDGHITDEQVKSATKGRTFQVLTEKEADDLIGRLERFAANAGKTAA